MQKYTILQENPIICRCAKVSKKQIIEAIKRNKITVEMIFQETTACCCCKSCYTDIQKLIEEYKKPWWKRFIDFWKD